MRRVKYLKTRIVTRVSQNVSTSMGALRSKRISFVRVLRPLRTFVLLDEVQGQVNTKVFQRSSEGQRGGYSGVEKKWPNPIELTVGGLF